MTDAAKAQGQWVDYPNGCSKKTWLNERGDEHVETIYPNGTKEVGMNLAEKNIPRHSDEEQAEFHKKLQEKLQWESEMEDFDQHAAGIKATLRETPHLRIRRPDRRDSGSKAERHGRRPIA